MTRIAVIGNAAGGKSTLSRKLGEALNIPLFPIDQIQWKPGWVPSPLDQVKNQHNQILAMKNWIIDGWGTFELIEERFKKADTIIFVDHPLIIHYWWALKRQFGCLFSPRTDGPEGCPMLPMTWQLMKMIWRIHYHLRPKLLNMIDDYRETKQIFHITSPKELRAFMLDNSLLSDLR